MKNTHILLVDDDPDFTFLASEELADTATQLDLDSQLHFRSAENTRKGATFFTNLLKTCLLPHARAKFELLLISDLHIPFDNEGLDLLRTAKAELELQLAGLQDEDQKRVRASVRFALWTSDDLSEAKKRMNGEAVFAGVALIGKNQTEALSNFCFPEKEREEQAA